MDGEDRMKAITKKVSPATCLRAEYDDRFRDLDVDPFELWMEEQVHSQDYSDGTVTRYGVASTNGASI
jgi:integrase/recombinase XerD